MKIKGKTLKICVTLALALAAGILSAQAGQPVQLQLTFSKIASGKTNVISSSVIMTKPGQEEMLVIGCISYNFKTLIEGEDKIVTDATIIETEKGGKTTTILMRPRLISRSGQNCAIAIGDKRLAYRLALTANIMEDDKK